MENHDQLTISSPYEEPREHWLYIRGIREAVNADGNFGRWDFKVLDDPKNLFEVIKDVSESRMNTVAISLTSPQTIV